MLGVEDWAEIRRLHRAEGMPIKVIVRVTGLSRNTVRAALASDEPPKYDRKPAGSIVDDVEPRIRELLSVWPRMPATVIAERIGWTRGITVLKDRVAELRPAFVPVDPSGRTSYAAGEVGQNDLWFPEITLPVGFGQTRTAKQLPVLTMVSGYSRWMSALLIPSRSAPDLFAGWWQILAGLGRVPRLLVWDGEGAIGRHRRPESLLTGECQAFRGTLATKVYVCAPRDPEAKGLVERANGYLETSFLPGRTFTSPADFNAQLQAWLTLVSARPRRALGCAPTERIIADRAAMIALPPVAPATGWRSSQRLARDHYVRLDGNDYSVHPGVIGRRIEVVADLERVRVLYDGRSVADHPRVWATHQTLTDPEHLAAAGSLRRELRHGHRDHRGRLRPAHEPASRDADVEIRCLGDYDDLFGSEFGLADTEGGAA